MWILHSISWYFHIYLNIILHLNLKVKLLCFFFLNLWVQLTLQEQMLYLSCGFAYPRDDGSAKWIYSYVIGSRFKMHLSNGSTSVRWHVTIMNVNSHIYILTIIPPTPLPPRTITRTAFIWHFNVCQTLCKSFCRLHWAPSPQHLSVTGSQWLGTPFYKHGNESVDSYVFTVSYRWLIVCSGDSNLAGLLPHLTSAC